MRVNKALVAVTVVTLAFGVWTFISPGHVPLFDARLIRLAETPAQGYCAGKVFWEVTRSQIPQQGDQELAEDCVRSSKLPNEVDLAQVVRQFCVGAADAGYDGPIDAGCVDFLNQNHIWPTYDGRLTDTWDAHAGYPYPGSLFRFEDPNGSRASGVDRASGDFRESDENR